MTTRIFVAKYIKDPRRWEPRNIGIMVVSDSACASRFLGEQQDGTVHRTAVRYIVNDTATYRDWVMYWKRTLTPGTQGINEIVQRTKTNYWIAEAGEVWVGDESPDELVSIFYGDLITSVEEEEATVRLSEAVDDLLQQAGVVKLSSFVRDKEVQSIGTTRRLTYRFPYYWQNGKRVVGQRVGNPAYLHDALWKFKHISSDYTAIAFFSGSDEEVKRYIEEVQEVPNALSIDVETADPSEIPGAERVL